MNDKTKKKASKLRLRLRAQLIGATLMMTSSMGLRHPSQDERDYVKREPIFKESANGSGDPPGLKELLGSAGENYIIGSEEDISNYFPNSAHVEKAGDRLKITFCYADDREIKYL